MCKSDRGRKLKRKKNEILGLGEWGELWINCGISLQRVLPMCFEAFIFRVNVTMRFLYFPGVVFPEEFLPDDDFPEDDFQHVVVLPRSFSLPIFCSSTGDIV